MEVALNSLFIAIVNEIDLSLPLASTADNLDPVPALVACQVGSAQCSLFDWSF